MLRRSSGKQDNPRKTGAKRSDKMIRMIKMMPLSYSAFVPQSKHFTAEIVYIYTGPLCLLWPYQIDKRAVC